MFDARRHQSHHTLLLREPQHLGEVDFSVGCELHLLFPEASTDQGEKNFNYLLCLSRPTIFLPQLETDVGQS